MTFAEGIALLSPIAASIAVVVTLANFGVSRGTLALALFDRRMVVYQEVRKASSLAMMGEKQFLDEDGLGHLHRALNEGHFLFGPEVAAYLTTLWKAGIEMRAGRDNAEWRAKESYHKAYMELADATTKLRTMLQPYMLMDHKLPWRPIRKLFG